MNGYPFFLLNPSLNIPFLPLEKKEATLHIYSGQVGPKK